MRPSGLLPIALAAMLSCRADAPTEKPAEKPAPTPTDLTRIRDETATRGFTELLDRLHVDVLDDAYRVAKRDVALAALRAPDRPSAIAFFATYCPPCIEEMSLFDRLRREGHHIAGVSMDTGNLETLAALLTEQKVGYQVGVLTERSLRTAAFAVDGLPTTLLVDRGGQVREILRGTASRAVMLDALERATTER